MGSKFKILQMFANPDRRRIILFIFLNLFFLNAPLKIYAQSALNRNEEFNPEYLKEKLFITTDRNIYIAGEKAWLKVFKMNKLTGLPDDMSRVIYIELLDRNNFPLRQLKTGTNGSSGAAGFIIPENTATGNYLIRAYTAWMQNWPAATYAYSEISVLNPFQDTENQNADDTLKSGSEKNLGSPSEDQEYSGSICSINSNKKVFSGREKVSLDIKVTDQTGNPADADLCVSIVKSSLLKPDRSVTSMPQVISPGLDTIKHLPELEGHLVSGMLMKNTGETLANTGISLSIVGKTARCRFTTTDENGRFNFVVKEPGTNEIVIQPLSSQITGYYVDLKQTFSTDFINYRTTAFVPDSNLIKELNKAVIAMQISNIYEPFRTNTGKKNISLVPDFYGKPEKTIIMSDYIELTTLREAVKEIIPDLYVMKHDGAYDFKMINKFNQRFENEPLVLVDGIPEHNFEKVLAIASKEIEKTDVINTRYFYSGNVFDGIVSFVTRKGDLSVMEYDNSMFRQVYEFCLGPEDFYSPDYRAKELLESRIPDFRNTLYWNPSLHTGTTGRAEIEFFTSDEKGEYTVIARGITSKGKIFTSSMMIEVK